MWVSQLILMPDLDLLCSEICLEFVQANQLVLMPGLDLFYSEVCLELVQVDQLLLMPDLDMFSFSYYCHFVFYFVTF